MQHKARNSNFTQVGLLAQKRADILKFAIIVQNNLSNFELLKISVFCQKRQENFCKKGRTTVNLL